MKKILFLDRDGTLIREPEDKQVDSLQKLEFMPGVFRYLSKIAEEGRYELVMVSNQDGLGTDSFPENDFNLVQDKLLTALKNEGITFSDVLIDKTFTEDQAQTRKPGIAMMTQYLNGGFDLENSFMVGDRPTDVEFARNLGCKSIYFSEDSIQEADFTAKTWKSVYEILSASGRIVTMERHTKETQITIRLNPDGSGRSRIHSGLRFFDHMLEQVAKHAMIDLDIHCAGDLDIDEHHSIEDTAICLGEAFLKALGDKKGIARYGFVLPMDESLAQVAIDFGGRPWLVWQAEFKREKIGDMPTEMFKHFFKSFTDAAKCNLNIRVEGENEHHMIESVFKAFAKAIKAAVLRDDKLILPSTKGML